MPPSFATALVAAMLIAGLGQTATPPASPPGTGSISGRVIDAVTGTSIARAQIFIRSMGRPDSASVQAGDDGRYTLVKLAAGEYQLRVEHPDYAAVESTIVRKDGRLMGIQVADGEQVTSIDFAMAPAGVISGLVTGDAGRPMPKARVTVMVVGQMKFVGAYTNERGEYEVRLPGGRYFVQAFAVLPAERLTTDLTYDTTYYPGVTNMREAVIVDVRVGDRVRDINIPLTRQTLKTVMGRVHSVTASSETIQLNLVSSPAGKLSRLRAQPDGSFRVDRLQPGRYIIWARRSSPDGVEIAAQPLDINDNIVDLDLSLGLSGRISGHVVTDDKTPVLDGIRVIAALMDGANDVDPTAPDQVEIDADGSFAIDGLFGTRRLRLTSLPPGWALKSILINGRDASPPDIAINGSATIDKVQIVITRQ